MNEVFKKMKSKKIQLDSEFWLMPDPYKGLILQREVEKEAIERVFGILKNCYNDIICSLK